MYSFKGTGPRKSVFFVIFCNGPLYDPPTAVLGESCISQKLGFHREPSVCNIVAFKRKILTF
jgi:hypothetical protein